MRTRLRTALSLIALITSLLQVGCQNASPPSVRLAAEYGYHPPATPTRGQSTNPERLTSKINLAGAIGEVLGIHFTIRSSGKTISDPILRSFDFRSESGTIGASAIEISRLHAVSVDDWRGWHIRSIPVENRDTAPLDALVPLDAPRGGMPNVLSPGVTYHFWADVRIPKGVHDGVYESRIELKSSDNRIGDLDLELTVWPIVLPDTLGFETIAELDHAALTSHHLDSGSKPSATESQTILLDAVRQMQRHRLAVVFPAFAPGIGIDGSAQLSLDWDEFDDVVDPILSGEAFQDRSPAKRWPLPIHPSLPLIIGESTSRQRLLSQYLTEVIKHFRDKNWKDQLYLLTQDPQSHRSIPPRDVALLIEPLQDQVHLVSTLPVQNLAPFGWTGYANEDFQDFVDEWAPPAQFLDRNIVATQQDAEKPTWFCADRPPFSGSIDVSASPTFVRVLPWQAASVHASQLYLGNVLDWPSSQQPNSPSQCIRKHPSNLLYPGTVFGMVQPVTSLRLKHLQRGLQDVAYLRLLREHGRSAIADRVLTSIVRYVGTGAYDAHYADGSPNGWPQERHAFDAARRVMAEEMLRVVTPNSNPTRDDDFARTAAWRRFNQITSQREITTQGVRMRMTGSPASPKVGITTHIEIPKSSNANDGGSVRLDGWPTSWSVGAALQTFRPSDRNEIHRVRIETVLPLESVSLTGSFDLEAVAEFATGQPITNPVSVRCITALRISTPPTIDGDLSDWPVGTTNVASEFRSIAPKTNPKTSLSTAVSAATLAIVMRDDQYLFVAINATTPNGTPEQRHSRKAVTYDDTIPVGEELVELMFDPLNLATRSPETIFHLVIKRTGSDLAEKGVGYDPPVGARSPWAADAEIAVAHDETRWTAEVRIPISSFGGGPVRNIFWGFNVSRFDAQASEYSTWSNAQGNAHDPISFGNLLFP